MIATLPLLAIYQEVVRGSSITAQHQMACQVYFSVC